MRVRHAFVRCTSLLAVGAIFGCGGGATGSGDGTLSAQPPVSQQNAPYQLAYVPTDTSDATAAARVTAGMMTATLTTIDSCALTSPCISGSNASSGAGVFGSSTNGRGVSGATHHNSTASTNAMYGVYGLDLSTSGSYDGGVYGNSPRGYGVRGVAQSGLGVYGQSGTSVAVEGTSGYIGVYGSATSYGTYGYSSSGFGAVGASSSGTAVYASSASGAAVYALTNGTGAGQVAIFGNNGNGNGSDITGGYIGLLGRSNQYPLTLTDANGNNVLFVDSAGNLYTHGTVGHFAATNGGASVATFGTTSVRPSVEDTGTAQLVGGQATVQLDPSLARTIDGSRPYRVFLTPGGDTRGLFVASKGPASFVVREVQGGRGNFAFDYHIYATQGGASRLSAATIAVPHAGLARAQPQPSLPTPANP